MAADVYIIGRNEFRGGGIVDGMDNAVVDWHDVVVDVGEVGTGGGVVITIEELWSALYKAWAITDLFPEVTKCLDKM